MGRKLSVRGKTILLFAGGAIGMIVFTVMMFGSKEDEKTPELEPLVAEVTAPEGEGSQMIDDKRQLYEQAEGRRSSEIEDYFNELAAVEAGEQNNASEAVYGAVQPQDELRGSYGGGGGSAVANAKTHEELRRAVLGDVDKDNELSAVERAERASKKSGGELTFEQQKELDSLRYMRLSEAIYGKKEDIREEETEPDRIEFASSSGTGGDAIISSLDDDDDIIAVSDTDRPVRCMFMRDEKLQSGQRVMVRLLEPLKLESIIVPENTHLSAIATLSGRLELVVNSIEVNGRIYPIGFDAYDYDGMKGIYCPQSGKEDKKRRATSSGSNILQSVVAGAISNGMANQVISNGASIINSGNKSYINRNAGYTFYLAKTKKK